MLLQLRQRKFCSIHIQTLQEIGRFHTFHPSQVLHISLTLKNLYLACWAVSYISSIPTWIRYLWRWPAKLFLPLQIVKIANFFALNAVYYVYMQRFLLVRSSSLYRYFLAICSPIRQGGMWLNYKFCFLSNYWPPILQNYIY